MAARSALRVGDLDQVRELIGMLDRQPADHLPALLHLAQALMDQAALLRLRGRDDTARALAEEARTIATRVGARPLLERMAELTSE